jgi:selenide,water dikinase
MLAASGVAAELDASAVPFLPGTLDLAREGVVPAGSRSNHRFVTPHTDWGDLDEAEQLALADAQTSGGLLIVASERSAEPLLKALASRGVPAHEVGRTREGEAGHLAVRGRPS